MAGRQADDELRDRALQARRAIIDVAARSKTAHVGSALSCVDLLVALYFQGMHITEHDWENRDIFILSKAHGALALYAVLMLKGVISQKTFEGCFQNDGSLPAHLDRFTSRGIEVSAGALGHGFNMALGMAYGLKQKKDPRRVFVLIGDGESEEGSIWEGALFASKLNIDNITVILDENNLQGYGRPRDLCFYEPAAKKWEAFGWEAFCIDGHDFSEITAALKRPHEGKPRMVIARTVKGKGVSFMEDQMKWHYFIVTEELKNQALKELG